MRATCQALTQLCATGRAGRATVVLHHALTGRAGAVRAIGIERSSFGRNSKLLQAWTRGQINIAPRSPEDNQRLVVACGKCSNGREFKTFAAILDEERMIYQLDPKFNAAEWEQSMHTTGATGRDPADALLEICATPCTRSEARKQLEKSGLSRAASYKAINRAIEEGLIIAQADKLALAE